MAVIPGDLMQPLGPGASHPIPETNPWQDEIPKDKAEKYPSKKENDALVPGSVHGWDYSTRASWAICLLDQGVQYAEIQIWGLGCVYPNKK